MPNPTKGDLLIVFVDFDGVVNHTSMSMRDEGMMKSGVYYADPRCVEHLKDLITKLDATIVVSSTWRILTDKEFFKTFFGDWFYDRMHKDWRTKRLGTIRGLEVRDWLERNIGQGYWRFKDYLILDDDQDFLWYQPLVHVNQKTGLDEKHVKKAMMIASGVKKIEIPEVLPRDLMEILSDELVDCKDKRRGVKATVAALHQKLVDFYH